MAHHTTTFSAMKRFAVRTNFEGSVTKDRKEMCNKDY